MLTGIVVKDTASALLATQHLHDKGTRVVIITSAELNDRDPSCLYLICSIYSQNKSQAMIISFPKRQENYTGTGDLFAALVLGYLPHTSNLELESLVVSLEKAVGAIQGVLDKTSQLQSDRFEKYRYISYPKARLLRSKELSIIPSKDIFEQPPRNFKVLKIIE